MPALMQLVFRAGERPGVAALRRAIAGSEAVAISHDPQAGGGSVEATGEGQWLELLLDGMTFDLSGLAPGPAEPLAAMRNHVDIAPEAAATLGAPLTLVAGPHLEGGRDTVPVVRAQAGLAAELLRILPGAVAVGWAPARSLIGREAFIALVDAWRAGGPFPAIGLVMFRETFGGDVQSEGLAFFTGQELHFAHGLFPDRAEATRIGVRLVDALVERPPLVEPERLVGPDGRALSLAPSRNGRFVRVGRD